jgi:hypothetical protein
MIPHRNRLVAALGACVLALGAADAAFAATTQTFDTSVRSSSATGSVARVDQPGVQSVTVDSPLARTISQTATGQILGSPNLTSMNVSIECAAVATPNPLAVGVAECYLLAPNGTRYNIPLHGAVPGAADATASAVLNIPVQNYRICMRANAFYQDNQFLPAPTICSS